jgi:tetratricopeptide (TPR) repeat protein
MFERASSRTSDSAAKLLMRFNRRNVVIALTALALAGIAFYWLSLRRPQDGELTAAHECLERRDFQLAGAHLDKYLLDNPDDLPARLLAAQTARREGANYRASEHLDVLERSNGSPAAIALERTLMQLQNGELENAQGLLDRCRAQPDTPDTPLILEAYLEGSLGVLEDPDGIRSKLGHDPQQPDPVSTLWAADQWLQRRLGRADQFQGFLWRARLQRFQGHHQESVADFERALQLNPDDTRTRMTLAMMLSKTEPEEALRHLKQLRERFPDTVEACCATASVLRALGRAEEAGRVVDACLTANPDSVRALVERAKVALDVERIADAEVWLRQAERLSPNDPEMLYSLSRCLHLAGQTESAKAYRDRFRVFEEERQKRENSRKMK